MACGAIGRRWRRVIFCAGLAALAAAGAGAQESQSWYSLAIAASHNSNDRVLELLRRGDQDPDAIDSYSGRTALDFAASFNNVAMATMLVDRGAHVDMRDPVGNTALYWAAERGSLDVMRYLLDNNAAVDVQNKRGETPLMAAAGDKQPGAVRLLIAHGADPRKQDYTGRDAFGWAAGHPAVMQALQAKR